MACVHIVTHMVHSAFLSNGFPAGLNSPRSFAGSCVYIGSVSRLPHNRLDHHSQQSTRLHHYERGNDHMAMLAVSVGPDVSVGVPDCFTVGRTWGPYGVRRGGMSTLFHFVACPPSP